MYKYLITVAGELPLKSNRTRPRFYRRLVENIRDALEREGIRLVRAEVVNAKVLVTTDVESLDVLKRVFGVYKVGRVQSYEFKDIHDLARWVAERSIETVRGKKFAVKVKRSGEHPFTSLDVAREIGSLLKPYSAGVDLENPDVVVELEVKGSKVYLYESSARGPGGLPVGVEGSALALFSGGFDSPVAAWLVAKRGVRVDFLHYILGSTQASYYAFLVAQKLSSMWLHGYSPLFIIVDFRDVVNEIVKKIEKSYRQVALRALMYAVGSRIASERGYEALVTGESIGQASSQTLHNLTSIEIAVRPNLPILRPLLGLDKEEIIDYSRRIGLYDLSSKVIETCTLAPSLVVTKTTPQEVLNLLNKIDESVLNEALSKTRVVNVLSSRPEDVLPPDEIEVDFIPTNAIVVDIRSEKYRAEYPIPGAVRFHELDLSKIPKDTMLVLVCDTGSVSYVLAKELREKGVKAFSLRGGIRGCTRLPTASS